MPRLKGQFEVREITPQQYVNASYGKYAIRFVDAAYGLEPQIFARCALKEDAELIAFALNYTCNVTADAHDFVDGHYTYSRNDLRL